MNKKRLIILILSITFVIAAGLGIYFFTPVSIPSSARAMLSFYTTNKPDAEITVAIINGDSTDIKAYGHGGKEISVPDRFYEIGPISKTITGGIAAKAVKDGYLNLDCHITDYLTLSSSAYIPTIRELITHCNAYADYLPKNTSPSDNPYSGITGNKIIAAMNSFLLKSQPPYLYAESDFGVVALSTVLSKIYDVDFYSILTLFTQNELGLKNTYVSVEGTIADGWQWNYDDAYIASLGLTSNISDMVKYAKLYLNSSKDYLKTAAKPLTKINEETSVGYQWLITDNGNILSQSGQTGHYASAITIDLKNRKAIIVLSNYANDKYGNTGDIATAFLQEIE